MGVNKTLVSIGMPVYNGERFIRQALDSLLAQEYENFELIISDNASTDGTQEICLKYAARDKRVQYYRNQMNMGAAWNFNVVMELSSGEYLMWASCHDLWEHTFISRCVEILKYEDEVVLCYPSADWIDINGNCLVAMPRGPDTRGFDRVSRCHVVLWGLQYAYPIYGLIRADALRQTKRVGATIGPDLILLFELSLLGEFAQIPEVLLHIRRMPDFGSWDDYIEKCLNKRVRGLPRRLLFWRMVFEHLRAINRHIRSMSGKAGLMLSVLFCIVMKHRWIRRGLAQRQ